MGAPGTKVPLLLNANISTIEARGPIDMLKSRYKYLIRIDKDEEKIAEKLVGSIVQEAGEFRIRWDVNKNILFTLSSTVNLSVYGKGVLEHGLGGFEGSVVDLVDNDSYVDITKEGKSTSLKLRVAMALDANTHATDNVKDVMTKVDKQLAAMQTLSLPDSDNQSVKLVMGQILQSTKSIMDKIADAHPFLKIAWSALAFVYEAVEKTTLEDKAVRDLAKSLREMLGVASARPDLLVIKDTTDVIAEMSLLALRIAQVIHEYSSSGVIGRTIRRDFSSLHSRIEKYQGDHKELMEQFRTRLGINVDIQVERVYQTVLELKTTGAGPTVSSSVQLFRPIATTRFVGRRAELERLRDHFKKTEAPVARRSFLLHGMGGIGKTQLCLHFVEDAVDSGLFSRVFFIDAATEDSTVSSLKSIFQNTAELKSSGQAESPDPVLNWISRLEEDWITVYENAEDFVAKYLPPGRKGNVLMTSRNPALARHTGGSHIPLDEMSEEDALALFKSSGCHDFLSPEDEVLSRQIISSLSFIPLAVDLAGAYTASSTGFCDLREYLDLLSLQRNQLFDSFSYSIAESTPYHNTVYGAWELSMKAIEARATSSHPQQEASQSAITILQIFSFLHHSNIDENMFKRSAVGYFARSDDLQDAFFQPPPLSPEAERIIKLDNTRSVWDANHFRKGINVLLSASLIKRSPDRKIYSVHPLIHEWIRNRHSTPNQSSILKDVHVIMLSSVSFDVTQYYHSIVSLIPHIKAYQQYTHCGEDMHGSYNDYMHERLQFVYQKAGLYQEEKQILLRMAECRKDKLGLKHPKTLYSMRAMATWYRKQSQRDESLSILGEVILLMKEIYGERHQITLDTMRELGWVHLVKEEYEEAEKIDTTVLKLQVEMLGKKHRDTLETMNDLSMVYAKQRHYEKSKTLLDETIDLSKELLGEDHPDTLERLDNLASTLCYQNKWKEGIDILVPLLETKKRVQGEEHPNTLYDIHQLACCYSNVGEMAKAEDMYLSAIKVKEKVLGEKHPSTMLSKSNLAVMYANRQRMDEAIRILEPLIVTSERVEQEEPPILISCMETLAYCLEVKGKTEEAENLYQKTIKLSVKIHGENHPRTYEMKQFLATLYTEEARWKEAETVLVSLLESQRNFLGTQHEDTLDTESTLDRVQSRLRGSPIDSEFASSGEDDDWTETSNTDDENSDSKGVEDESAADGEKAMVFKADT